MTTVLVNQSFEERYKPRTLNDVVFPDVFSEQQIKAYISGQKRRPLLLYGPGGTGKTTVAKLLPYAMCSDFDAAIDLLYIRANARNTTASVVDDVEEFSKRVPFGLCPFKVVFIDEVDVLVKATRDSLKALTEDVKQWVLFIFTTNNPNVLERAFKSRCTRVEFGKADPNRWLPRMRDILKRENVTSPSATTLLNLAESADGDVRDLLDSLQDVAIQRRALGKVRHRKAIR